MKSCLRPLEPPSLGIEHAFPNGHHSLQKNKGGNIMHHISGINVGALAKHLEHVVRAAILRSVQKLVGDTMMNETCKITS
jgi:hypothetical protein